MLVHLRDGGGGVVELVATAATPLLVTAENKTFQLSCVALMVVTGGSVRGKNSSCSSSNSSSSRGRVGVVVCWFV